MVLPNGEPVNLAPIQVPTNNVSNSKHYVTDDGFVVPCIDSALRQRLLEQAEKHGLSQARQIECMGRCISEMSIQLVGGPIRFLPKNAHQRPSILVLVNGQIAQGAYALAAARLLMLRSCFIFVYVTNKPHCVEVANELRLFESSVDSSVARDPAKFRLMSEASEFYSIKSVDLILNGLESSAMSLNAQAVMARQSWFKRIIEYLDECKASVVTIDPPSEGAIVPKSKWCIVPVLPMSMDSSCGRIYLADLGFTHRMFDAVGVKYKSPFGAKFLIPLHDS
jgi:enhancer of mRNA-decapping protein 3